MLYQQIEYLKFLFKTKNQVRTNSPFIFNLTTKCLYKKTNHNFWGSFLKVKRQLLDTKKKIKVTDFGSGSRVFKSDERQVSRIVKVAGISNKKAKLLIRLINYFQPKKVLEIGTSLGLGTSAIKIGNKEVKITTLEGCPETSKIAHQLFNRNGFKTIDILTGNFKETLPKIIKNNQFDFIYFDGNHTKTATLEYFDTCLPTINNDTVWVFDDIYWNNEMQETWAEIKKHPKVTITVDLFYLGIVFFRKEKGKEHFKIRV